MKILGALIYLSGFLIIAYIITETRIDIGGSFGGVLFILAILALTMTIGSALMKVGDSDNNGNNNKG